MTRASLLHARGLVLAAQADADRAEASFVAALEIIEPTMYATLAREIRRSLDSLHANTVTVEMARTDSTSD